MEVQKLLKLDNVTNMVKLGNGLRQSNLKRVARALQDTVNIKSIEENVSYDTTQAATHLYKIEAATYFSQVTVFNLLLLLVT